MNLRMERYTSILTMEIPMDSHSFYLNETLLVLTVCIFKPKDRWIEPDVRLTKTMQKSSLTVDRFDS